MLWMHFMLHSNSSEIFCPLFIADAFGEKKSYWGSKYNCCCERFGRKDNYIKLRGIILALFLEGMVCNSNTKGA